jgi:hypothetical protein
MINKQIEKILLNFKSANINTLDIFMGNINDKAKDIMIFNKKLDDDYYNKIYQSIFSKNYNSKTYQTKIYNYGDYYYNVISNKYVNKLNSKNIVYNGKLFLTYLENVIPSCNFSCHKDYNVIEQMVNEFALNNEIKILFINNNQIKINIKINHNIDLSIKTLYDLNL